AELARGGMGIVYHGRDPLLARDLAVKVLHEAHAGSEELRWRFRNEARLMARLQHPGIVPVYDVAEFPDGRPCFTMRLVRGRGLSDLLAERGSPAEGLPHFTKVFEQVCQAMAYAHHQRIIHRDLKPGNVLVAPFGVVKVMDWGVAKDLGDPSEPPAAQEGGVLPAPGRTESGRILGTPACMAPEQARAEPGVDERADVFGLGAILCVILTGQPPYGAEEGAVAYRRAVCGDVSSALAALAACPAERELKDLARCCLSPRAADRPRHAGEVARAVVAYMESDLRRAERDLARFFDLSLDLFCLAGLDGFFRRLNPNFSRVLGHSDEELLRRPFMDFVHPDDQEATRAAMGQLSQGLAVVRFRNRYRDARGGWRCFEWTAKAVPEGGVVFAVARDVTATAGP
ncbi:MAG: protein kinase, partial [Gemmataceae bacterium]|nr:protein kinase [Gemmataceae bacterium]